MTGGSPGNGHTHSPVPATRSAHTRPSLRNTDTAPPGADTVPAAHLEVVGLTGGQAGLREPDEAPPGRCTPSSAIVVQLPHAVALVLLYRYS